MNALIALETGVIADTGSVIAWDGVQRQFASWNGDHSLGTGFRHSVVWYYQEIARRIGEQRMQDYLERVGYGNRNTGGGIDRFWLDGDLRISAMEQIDLLVRLHNDNLPFSASTMQQVRAIMREETEGNDILRAKTGWGLRDPHDIGWYVGYCEGDAGPVFFALNIDIADPSMLVHRKQIVMDILKAVACGR